MVKTPVPIMLATTKATALVNPSWRAGLTCAVSSVLSNLAEPNLVIVLENVLLLDRFKPGRLDFGGEHFLTRAHVVQEPNQTLHRSKEQGDVS